MTTEISIEDLRSACDFDKHQKEVYDGWVKQIDEARQVVDTVTDIKLLENMQKDVSDRYKVMEQLTGNFYLLKLNIDGRISYLKKDKNRTCGK